MRKGLSLVDFLFLLEYLGFCSQAHRLGLVALLAVHVDLVVKGLVDLVVVKVAVRWLLWSPSANRRFAGGERALFDLLAQRALLDLVVHDVGSPSIRGITLKVLVNLVVNFAMVVVVG
ncbi:hypothetical protein Dimus_018901, partial [Dionaea muscipula]